MYGYVYLTVNLKTGRKYIGQHKSSEFDPNYLGSGKILLQAVKKYGKANFHIEILEKCVDKEHLNSQEAYWIEICDAVNSVEYYNIVKDAFPPIQKKGSGKGRISEQKGIKKENSVIVKMKKAQNTEEAKKWKRDRFKGSKYINNGEIEKRVTESDLTVYISDGWILGRLPDRKVFGKYSENTTYVPKKIIISVEQRKKMNEARWTEDKRKDTSEKMSQLKWVNKNNKNKRVNITLLGDYIASGWELGYVRSK